MRRVVIGVVVSAVLAGIFTVASEAESQRRRRRRAAPQAEAIPHSAAIAQSMSELHWGMTRDEVYGHYVKQIRGRFRDRIAKAPGLVEEDRYRHDEAEEIQAIRRSYVRFNGQTTGWDVSFLRDEFTHGNGESMLVVRDSNSQNFYFFINNRLWKWYKAFNADVFAGQTFDQFTGALQTRFGEAARRQGRLTQRAEEKQWLEWQDATTRLRAIDENRFYGFYCLVFDEKATLANLDRLRTHTRQVRDSDSHAVVDAVTGSDEAPSEANADIVDRITGRIRHRQQAPEGEGAAQGGGRGRSGAAAPATGSGGQGRQPAASDDDPLRDLDL